MRLIRVTLPNNVKPRERERVPAYDVHQFEEESDVNRAIDMLISASGVKEEDIIGLQWISDHQFFIVAKGEPQAEERANG
jgi:hypothetical protein